MAEKSYEEFLREAALHAWNYANKLERRIDEFRVDEMGLLSALVIVSVTLGIVLYQWLVVGMLTCHA